MVQLVWRAYHSMSSDNPRLKGPFQPKQGDILLTFSGKHLLSYSLESSH